jgi:hypothetical protein
VQSAFTVHCITWQAGAPLLRDVRASACEMGLFKVMDLLTDDADELSRHAFALSQNGYAIGCARITPEGCIERIIVLPYEKQIQIGMALVEVLHEYANQIELSTSISQSVKDKAHSGLMAA